MEKTITKEKTILMIINLFAQILFAFYNIFFNIFILKIVNDINFVLLYNCYIISFGMIWQIVMTKILNQKTFNTIYRLSFFMLFIATFIVFFVKANTIYYLIWIIGAVFAIAQMAFYVPHEMLVMHKNKSTSMHKFLGLSSIISSISGILSPFISGYVIGNISYTILFAILLVFALAAFILSFFIKSYYTDNNKITYKQFVKIAFKDKKIKSTYWAYTFYRIFEAGLIQTLLPVLLFLKTGSEFSVGIYKTLIAAVAMILLFVYTYYAKHKTIINWIENALMVISSILLIIYPTFVTFIIYYFVQGCVTKLFNNYSNNLLFTCIKNTPLEESRKYHHLTFSVMSRIFMLISYGIAMLIYNFLRTDFILSIFVAFLTIFFIVATIIFTNTEKLPKNNLNNEFTEQK